MYLDIEHIVLSCFAVSDKSASTGVKTAKSKKETASKDADAAN